jgi:hypothetical protein
VICHDNWQPLLELFLSDAVEVVAVIVESKTKSSGGSSEMSIAGSVRRFDVGS